MIYIQFFFLNKFKRIKELIVICKNIKEEILNDVC